MTYPHVEYECTEIEFADALADARAAMLAVPNCAGMGSEPWKIAADFARRTGLRSKAAEKVECLIRESRDRQCCLPTK